MPITVDTQTGRLYFGTGNPSPDVMGGLRPGCDPWADATVALDAHTGKFLWGHSQVCNDSYDYDSMQAPMILTVYQHGKAIRAVGEGNKEGFYWIFDAATGKVLAKSPALAKQTKNRPLPNGKGVAICPGSAGGIEFSPAAFNAAMHRIFQPTLNFCQIYTAITAREAAQHHVGAIDVGGSISNGPGPYDGNMAAISSDTGKLLWYTHVNGPMIGGALATASGLVFSGSDDTHFYAFDARTGKILWHPKLGLAFGGAPIAYQVNGTEYIAIAAGGNDIAPGYTTALGGTLAVFKLGGGPIHPFPVSTSGTFVPESPQLPSLKGFKLVDNFMYVDAGHHHVVIKTVAGLNGTNSGFNFDGWAKGQANFIVPVGWNVEFELSNKQSLPHSLGIASDLKTPPTLPFFGFIPVATPNANVGIGPNVVQIIGLTASHADRFYMVCLVPGHLKSGMWDTFTVSSTATMPSIQVTK
jgi:outer membrane protein assembly factor BamB